MNVRGRTWSEASMMWGLFCGVLMLVAPGVVRADDSHVQEFREVVEENAELILFIAHPMAEYKELLYCGTDTLRTGYKVTYRFVFDSPFSGENYSELRFYLHSHGHLDFIRPGERSCVWPPFTGSNLVISAVREMVEDDPDLQNNKELIAALERADAKGICEAILKALHWVH